MPESSSFLIVRLQMEKEKLLGWAILAKISDDNEQTASSSFKVNRHTVIDALREIQILLLDSSQLRRRYKLDLAPAPSDTHHVAGAQLTRESRLPLRDDYSALQKRALSFIEKTRKYPRRLQWAAFDKTHFEHLLSDLQGLNDNMMRFLDVYERNRHFQMQEATFMQILQVNNRMHDLFELMHSLKESTQASTDDGDKRRRAYEDRIIRMTRFKAVSIAIEIGNEGADSTVGSSLGPETDTPGSEIPLCQLRNLSPDTEERPARSLATCTFGGDDEIQVWIEWRYYEELLVEDSDDDNENNHPSPPPFVAQRISRLARLLSDREKPAEFLVPECIGYVQDEENSRFGFVFKSLSPASGTDGYHHRPITLLGLLSSTTTQKPSLTARVHIARMVATSIWYLHATNWLHKSLRSENIVFERGSATVTGVDLRNEKPFICGFDYSRPANIGEETERPVENLLHDMYRHPKVQFDVPREGRSGFNKLHDIYSLGVVLYEIAVWKPITKALGVDGAGAIKASMAKSVHSRLLAADSIALLESQAGDAVASAVRLCLDGSLIDQRDDNMSGPDSNARLQLEFGEKVVSVLDGISI